MLLYMDTFPAFCCLANLLNAPILVDQRLSLLPRLVLTMCIQLCFYRMDMSQIGKYVRVLDAIMADNIPRVYNHLKQLDITTDLYIMDWILTLFSKVIPPLSSSSDSSSHVL